MANSYTLLANLRAGRCSNTAEVCLLRFWEARNINKGGELMSIEMLLIDEADTMVQGCVPAVHQRKFRERLTEGSVYTLSRFDVTRSNPKFMLTDGPDSIRFNEGTDFEKLAATARTIPTEHFRFRPHGQILELANTSRHLPDVIGEVRAIRSTITDRLPGAQRVMLTLRVESDVSGRRAFHLKLPGGGADETGSSSKVVHAQKIEPLTIAELNEFVLSAEPQIIEFLCTAKVTGIQLDDGWCYIGCSLCSKKLIREETSFNCPSCNETNAVAELKYRVVFSVSDPTGTSSFLGFDKEVAKLTNVLASEAAQIVGIGISAHVDTELPRTLTVIVGNTYTFQLKLTDFNFTANHQTFTISRMFAAPEIAPTPSFATVTRGSAANGAIGSREAAEEEQFAMEESAHKKAHDEELFGNNDDSDYSETDDLIRRDQAELSLERSSQVHYPPQPEVEFGFLQVCYCGAKPLLATSNTRQDQGRRYYTCAKKDDGQCHVYKWWDEALMEEMRARDIHVLQLGEKVESLTLLTDYDTEQKIRNLEKIVGDMAKEKSSFSYGFECFVIGIVVLVVVIGLVVMFG
ncbi:hypothetical protein F2Q70_00009819 [Brassica cretica]|uniref:GRF-type domain-containing protein n=1 Tax=Brassica cretica TaxID=69181 RepID=A0A8S9JCX7_BRACR|nr:hypothetical protein F2Q68_00002831 [Brassica cretica]KAF2612502.1 hypothetical protein F2Q70_00009819 [Brassica cretica]